MHAYHTPVLLKETIELLNIQPGKWYIDTTLGGGGHTEAILKAGGKVIGIDQDEEAIKEVAKKYNLTIKQLNDQPTAISDNLILVRNNFTHLRKIVTDLNIGKISGILFDLGVSSHQLDIAERGFSFGKDAPLDMRMNQTFGATAADLVNGLYERELIDIFTEYGEEKYANRIAKKIVESRKTHPIQTTKQLADLVKFSVPRSDEKIHPATRVFQALRIAVNDELNIIQETLPQALELLFSEKGPDGPDGPDGPKGRENVIARSGRESSGLPSDEAISNNNGRLAVISFHSLEDRIVKTTFKDFEEKHLAQVLTPKPLEPSLDEVYDNPRARSSKLRAIKAL